MEGAPKAELSVEQYENSLEVKLAGITEGELKTRNSLIFTVSHEFNIFISDRGHKTLSDSHGGALAEGYIIFWHRVANNGNKKLEIEFKPEQYEIAPGFQGSFQEFLNLKRAIENKIGNFLQTVVE